MFQSISYRIAIYLAFFEETYYMKNLNHPLMKKLLVVMPLTLIIPLSVAFGVTPIRPVAPKDLHYAFGRLDLLTGDLLNKMQPSNSGGSASTYSISCLLPNKKAAALPSGLIFTAATGAISGSAKAATATDVNCAVKAINAAGFALVNLPIRVTNPAPPSGLVYNNGQSDITLSVGALASLQPLVSGNSIIYSINPKLPAGLSFDPTTGRISGTPNAEKASTVYTVVAKNAGGKVSATFKLSTKIPLPPWITYGGGIKFVKGVRTIITPSTQNSPFNFTINSSLPDGLAFDSHSGSISGTLQAQPQSKSYRVIAQNGNKVTGFADFHIVVVEPPPAPVVAVQAPASLAYDDAAPLYVIGSAIKQNKLNYVGGDAKFSIAPALPAGLMMDASGNLSGTPTGIDQNGNHNHILGVDKYIVTASNISGTKSIELNLIIDDVPPAKTIELALGNDFQYQSILPSVWGFGRIDHPLPAGIQLYNEAGRVRLAVISHNALVLPVSSYRLTIQSGNENKSYTVPLKIFANKGDALVTTYPGILSNPANGNLAYVQTDNHYYALAKMDGSLAQPVTYVDEVGWKVLVNNATGKPRNAAGTDLDPLSGSGYLRTFYPDGSRDPGMSENDELKCAIANVSNWSQANAITWATANVSGFTGSSVDNTTSGATTSASGSTSNGAASGATASNCQKISSDSVVCSIHTIGSGNTAHISSFDCGDSAHPVYCVGKAEMPDIASYEFLSSLNCNSSLDDFLKQSDPNGSMCGGASTPVYTCIQDLIAVSMADTSKYQIYDGDTTKTCGQKCADLVNGFSDQAINCGSKHPDLIPAYQKASDSYLASCLASCTQ